MKNLLIAIVLIALLSPQVEAISPRAIKSCVSGLHNSKELRVAARRKAYHMDRYNYWSHKWEGENISFKARKKYKKMGEVLAIGHKSMKEVCDAWFASPTHREVLTTPIYNEYGLYIKQVEIGKRKGWLVVLLVGKRKM